MCYFQFNFRFNQIIKPKARINLRAFYVILMKRLFTLFMAVFFLSACGTIKPDAPIVVANEKKAFKPAPVSTIEIPLKINLKPYFDETDKSLDRVFKGNEEKCPGVSFQYVFARSPIKFEGIGKEIKFDVDGKYSLKLNYCPSCNDWFSEKPVCVTPRIYASCGVDEPMRKISVGYSAEIGLNKDYSLYSKAKLQKVEPKSPCKITAFSYDATETLKEELEVALKDLEKTIDESVAEVTLRPEIEEVWKTLNASTDVAGYGYLDINPQSLALSKIKYYGDSATVNVVLNARPKINSTPSKAAPKPLPNLSKYKKSDGFDISMDVSLMYDSLNAIFDKNFKGTEIEVKGKTVIFDDVEIHGANNQSLSIKVDISGSKKGTIYLAGTPVFNASEQHISFPDLQFDIKTKDALIATASWMFDKKITKLMREQASMDLRPYLDSLVQSINENLNVELDEGVHLKGAVKSIEINEIQPLANDLFVRIHSKGKLEILMD